MQRRESSLIETLRLVRGAGDAGADVRKIVGQAERILRISQRTARGYLEDLKVRGWISIRFGICRATIAGDAELKQANVTEAKEISA